MALQQRTITYNQETALRHSLGASHGFGNTIDAGLFNMAINVLQADKKRTQTRQKLVQSYMPTLEEDKEADAKNYQLCKVFNRIVSSPVECAYLSRWVVRKENEHARKCGCYVVAGCYERGSQYHVGNHTILECPNERSAYTPLPRDYMTELQAAWDETKSGALSELLVAALLKSACRNPILFERIYYSVFVDLDGFPAEELFQQVKVATTSTSPKHKRTV